jgi:phospholipase C
MESASSLRVMCMCGLVLLLAGCQGIGSQPSPTSYQLTVAVAGAGAGTVTSSPAGITCSNSSTSGCTASFTQGTAVTLNADPITNDTFVGWSGGCSGAANCSVTLNAASSVTATFGGSLPPPNSYPLTITLAGAGTGTVTSSPAGINCSNSSTVACTASFTQGTAVTLSAAPSTNDTFAGWSGGCTGTTSCSVTLSAASSVTATFGGALPPPNSYPLTITLAGAGAGTVTSNPPGISCSNSSTIACTASFTQGTAITLSEAPITNDTFAGWSGGCTGTTSCSVTLSAASSVTATFGGSLQNNINHIILFAQENRSLDHYFGQMMAYWAANGYGTSGQTFDGLPQSGTPASNPGCPPGTYGDSCGSSGIDPNNPIQSFHFSSVCQENQSPFWNEAHEQWDPSDATGSNPNDLANPPLTGFVWTAAYDSQNEFFMDVLGIRAMGFFDGSDLNYYYYLASNFATSDRWFAPIMSRTQLNRMYLMAATSQGRAYPIGSGNSSAMCGSVKCGDQLPATTIFEELQNAGISWRIYMDPTGLSNSSGQDCSTMPQGTELSTCIAENSYINQFTYEGTILNNPTLLQNLQPIAQYQTDVANGTLPAFALIEPASNAGLDEHPSDSDEYPVNVQAGQNYAATQVINPLLESSKSWSDTALIFSFDEWGGYYDHVPPQAMAPAGNSGSDPIAPADLMTGDVCTGSGQLGTGMCTFGWTGYRVPAIVISPFSGMNYVSHTIRDTTSVLNLVEERFGIAALTGRDAAQPKMDEFFNFVDPPWTTPPSTSQLPTPNTSGSCDAVPPASWNDPATLTVEINSQGLGTVSSTPAGINACGSSYFECEYTFTSGGSVTIVATPATGHTFTSWGVGGGDPYYACDGSTSPTCTFTMAGPMEAVANFQ